MEKCKSASESSCLVDRRTACQALCALRKIGWCSGTRESVAGGWVVLFVAEGELGVIGNADLVKS